MEHQQKHIPVEDQTPIESRFKVRRVIAAAALSAVALAGASKGAEYIGDRISNQQKAVQELNQPVIDAINANTEANEHFENRPNKLDTP